MTTQDEGIDEHLDLLRLDALRAGEGTPEELAHVARCPECTEELEALRLLADDVAALRPEAVRVPEAVDRAVLAAFRSAAEPKVVPFPARFRLRWAGPAVGLALAAGVAAVVVFRTTPPREARGPAPPVPVAAEAPSRAPADRQEPVETVAAEAPGERGGLAAPTEKATATAEQRVTILDAYRLALRVQEREPEEVGSDANGDGVVDGKDVEALARLAVALR